MFTFIERDRIANIVKDLRGDMTLREMGKLLGVSATTVRAWEQGESVPMMDQLEAIAIKKGCSFPYLYYSIKGTKPTVKEVESLVLLLPELDRYKVFGSVIQSLNAVPV